MNKFTPEQEESARKLEAIIWPIRDGGCTLLRIGKILDFLVDRDGEKDRMVAKLRTPSHWGQAKRDLQAEANRQKKRAEKAEGTLAVILTPVPDEEISKTLVRLESQGYAVECDSIARAILHRDAKITALEKAEIDRCHSLANAWNEAHDQFQRES